jgi:tRNA dimethylallyltransferase
LLPVVFLLGTTGVGKSKLSLDMAEALHGEIVNADSMQVYGGNQGVMTAKPTMEERERVPHHLYDVVDMNTKDFNVNKYLSLAIPAIADIHSRHKFPIVVGGTNYYIEGLLF